MKNTFVLPLMASMLLAFASCTKAPEINVIPCPESVEQHDGIFRVAGVPVKADHSSGSIHLHRTLLW